MGTAGTPPPPLSSRFVALFETETYPFFLRERPTDLSLARLIAEVPLVPRVHTTLRYVVLV